jgi:hypothetical protein
MSWEEGLAIASVFLGLFAFEGAPKLLNYIKKRKAQKNGA